MATANDHYAAFLKDGSVYVKDLGRLDLDEEARCLQLPKLLQRAVLSFSTLHPQLLAVSSGPRILVFDVVHERLQHTIPGNGRMITALAWSAVQKNLLATGAIDGMLSLWSLENPSKPTARLRVDGACSAIACGLSDGAELASIHDSKIVVSRQVCRTLRPASVLEYADEKWKSVSWHPTKRGLLLSCSLNGKVYLWNLGGLLSASDLDGRGDADSCSSDSSDSEDGFFGNLDGVAKSAHQSPLVSLEGSMSQAQWIGHHGILCLGSSLFRYSIWAWNNNPEKAAELWSGKFDYEASLLGFSRSSEHVFILGTSHHRTEAISIPEHVLAVAGVELADSSTALPDPSSEDARHGEGAGEPYAVTPISISTLKTSGGSFAKTSRQLQLRRVSQKVRHEPIQPPRESVKIDRRDVPSPPPPMSMTSSLELPRPRDNEGSPMPFLSPSIPAQKSSPGGEIPALDDSVKLPSLPEASFDSSVQSASAAEQESDDSDDETFVEGMQGSASFLPGGINVPLPKACAALFTPTGELLTFFPPRPKVSSRGKDIRDEKHDDPKTNAKRVAKLFPSFGNLAGEPHWADEDDDSGCESTSSVSAHTDPVGVQSNFFFPSSFPSQQSWKARISPTKHSFTEQSPHKVIVSLHDVRDVGPLLPNSRQLAAQYRVLCDGMESGAELCRYNADCAESLGPGEMDDVAGIWHLAALLLEDLVPLQVMSDGNTGNDILVIARKAIEVAQMESREVAAKRPPTSFSGKLCWSEDPFGAAWIVRSILDWAQSRADTQLLALLSAVLAEVQDNLQQSDYSVDQGLMLQLPSYRRDYFASEAGQSRSRRLTNQSIPIFRTDSIGTSNAVYESPVKLKRSSTTSSRNQSQPSTPYLTSESTTPPFSLPNFSRQGTQLSGSASPEQHRSSFSAAAKYYAQSISDKFASYGAYGTSPPARKMGTSPSNTNEFSTSFPSGSWGKSVSFASTTNTTKTSMLSTSLDAARIDEDEGYDSDKTVEDLSLPQTPRDAECAVMLKNDRLFDNDISGGSRPRLLPDDLVAKARLWCEYYAEQLRCWDLLPQAAELEKVCEMTSLASPLEQTCHAEEIGVVPAIVPHGSKACTICAINMTGAQFFCPACAHAAHLNCLEDFIEEMCVDDGEEFACPAGCGCLCADLPFGGGQLEVEREVREDRPKKKASFTDPRRWRARVEGDEW